MEIYKNELRDYYISNNFTLMICWTCNMNGDSNHYPTEL